MREGEGCGGVGGKVVLGEGVVEVLDEGLVVSCQGELMLLCSELDDLLVQWMKQTYEDDRTYCVVAELRHDVLHCLLILFRNVRNGLENQVEEGSGQLFEVRTRDASMHCLGDTQS